MKTTIGLIQTQTKSSPEASIEFAKRKVSEAAKRGAKIICLEELFKTPYFPQTKNKKYLKLAETIPGPTTGVFSELAKKLRVVIIVPIFEQTEDAYFNSVVVIDADGEMLGTYRKMHLPNDPCFYEQFYFSPGDLGFKTFKTKYATIGVLICWDQWFPEAARLLSAEGAQIIFYPTAIGWLRGVSKKTRAEELEAWQIIQRSHAIANGVFVASVNRAGKEGKLTFWGNSFVSGPFGEIIKQASSNKEELLIAQCDFSKIKKIRKVWPFLTSRRLDHYGTE